MKGGDSCPTHSKLGNINNPNDFRCCFCCHVRTATICYGMLHVILHILVFVLLIMVIQHPNLLMKDKTDDVDFNLVKSTVTSSNKMLKDDINSVVINEQKNSDVDQDYYTLYIKQKKWGMRDVKLALLITMCTFMLSAMLVYGSLKGRPIYLMPFFCFKVLDLGIAFVTLASYFTYMPDIRYITVHNQDFPFREQLMKMDLHWLSVAVLAFFVLMIIIKIYFINMVWACYKYLVMKQFIRLSITSYVTNDVELMMPPDYDTVSKHPYLFPTFQTSPPPYAEAENASRSGNRAE